MEKYEKLRKEVDVVFESRQAEMNNAELVLRGFLKRGFDGWRIILLFLVVGSLLALVLSFIVTPWYTATVSMLPQTPVQGAGILGRFASLTGEGLSGDTPYEGLFLEILRSDRILDKIINRKWNYSGSDSPVTLFDVFNICPGDSSAHSTALCEARLKNTLRDDVVFFYRDKLTGYMVLRAKVPNDPVLAADLANCLIDALDEYNRYFRKNKATQQKEFVSKRLIDIESQLKEAEENLTDFLEHNRNVSLSPFLLRRRDALEREVQATSSIWIELRRQLELARLDEQKQIISIDILDSAKVPAFPSSPRRGQYVFFGGAIGLGLGLVFVLFNSRKRL